MKRLSIISRPDIIDVHDVRDVPQHPRFKSTRALVVQRHALCLRLLSLTAVMEPPMFGVMEPQAGR